MLKRTVLTFALLSSSSVFAHEGHGHPEYTEGLMHYVVNPSHSVVAVAGCVAAAGVVMLIRTVLRHRSGR